MPSEKRPEGLTGTTETAPAHIRFPELAEIQLEIEKRIRDNKRFLERFMDEDFVDGEEVSEEDDADFEEL